MVRRRACAVSNHKGPSAQISAAAGSRRATRQTLRSLSRTIRRQGPLWPADLLGCPPSRSRRQGDDGADTRCYCPVMLTIRIRAEYDPEASVWVAQSDDIPLVTEAETVDALRAKLPGMISDLIE